jgi:hypothetical protein
MWVGPQIESQKQGQPAIARDSQERWNRVCG